LIHHALGSVALVRESTGEHITVHHIYKRKGLADKLLLAPDAAFSHFSRFTDTQAARSFHFL